MTAAATMAADVHTMLLARGETIAVAESLTGGLVVAALTSMAGASATVRGGLVVYATDLKASLAGVDVAVLSTRGAVDPTVAEQLATGVRDRLGASWGAGVTGVAGPDSQDGHPVGTVHLAVAGLRAAPSRRSLRLGGDREQIRSEAVLEVLRLVRDSLTTRE